MNKQFKKVLLMSLLAAVFMIVALVCVLVLPIIDVQSFELTGLDYWELLVELDLIEELEFPGMMVYMSMVIAALALITAVISAVVRKRAMLIAPLVLSVAAMPCLPIGLDEAIEYGAIGFALFMSGCAWCLICCVIGLIPVRKTAAEVPPAEILQVVVPQGPMCCRCGTPVAGMKFCRVCGTPVAEQAQPVEPDPIPVPAVPEGPKCSCCGSDLVEGMKFCRQCGTPVAEQAQPVEPDPIPAPVAPESPKCHRCGSDLAEGMKFCRICGAPVAAESTPVPAPAAAEAKSEKKTCRRCGAMLMEGAKFCAICAAPVAEIPVVRPEPRPERKVCRKCGTALQPGAKFCVACATPVEVVGGGLGGVPKSERRAICPHCGARQSEENRYCRYCSSPMGY